MTLPPPQLVCFQTSSGALRPTRATPGAIGLDLRAIGSDDLNPHTPKTIDVGLGFLVPAGHYLRITGRMYWSRRGIAVLGGIVSPDSRASVKIVMINHGRTIIKLNRGDKVAQVILEKAAIPVLQHWINAATPLTTPGFRPLASPATIPSTTKMSTTRTSLLGPPPKVSTTLASLLGPPPQLFTPAPGEQTPCTPTTTAEDPWANSTMMFQSHPPASVIRHTNLSHSSGGSTCRYEPYNNPPDYHSAPNTSNGAPVPSIANYSSP